MDSPPVVEGGATEKLVWLWRLKILDAPRESERKFIAHRRDPGKGGEGTDKVQVRVGKAEVVGSGLYGG